MVLSLAGRILVSLTVGVNIFWGTNSPNLGLAVGIFTLFVIPRQRLS